MVPMPVICDRFLLCGRHGPHSGRWYGKVLRPHTLVFQRLTNRFPSHLITCGQQQRNACLGSILREPVMDHAILLYTLFSSLLPDRLRTSLLLAPRDDSQFSTLPSITNMLDTQEPFSSTPHMADSCYTTFDSHAFIVQHREREKRCRDSSHDRVPSKAESCP